MKAHRVGNGDSCGSEIIMERLEERIVLDGTYHYFDDAHLFYEDFDTGAWYYYDYWGSQTWEPYQAWFTDTWGAGRCGRASNEPSKPMLRWAISGSGVRSLGLMSHSCRRQCREALGVQPPIRAPHYLTSP